jgi:hypothetical protein
LRDPVSDTESHSEFLARRGSSPSPENLPGLQDLLDLQDLPDPDSDLNTVEWTSRAIDLTQSSLGDNALYDILTACSCTFPEEELTAFRDLYRRTGDIGTVHTALQEWFIGMIRTAKQLDSEHVDFMVRKGMGMAGLLDGNHIRAVKIPKEFTAWYEEKDPAVRKKLYCHCTRIRKQFDSEKIPAVSGMYCLCGAGFYRHLWEYILEQPVTVTAAESLLSGNDLCVIEIDIGSPGI